MSAFYQNTVAFLLMLKYSGENADEVLVLRKMGKTDPRWELASSFNYACNNYLLSNYYMCCARQWRLNDKYNANTSKKTQISELDNR